jgi:transketolase
MMASHYKLDNLTVILDHNTLQITGRNRDVCSPYPIDEKFAAFGWKVTSVNGNKISELRKVFKSLPLEKGKPNLIIANTIKGKGISFMEDQKKWHHGVPSDEQYKLAIEELKQQLEILRP